MKYLFYIKGNQTYYEADEYELGDVVWTDEEVVIIKNPTELLEDIEGEPATLGVRGSLFIPKNSVSHIVVFE